MITFYATFCATDVRDYIPRGTSVLLPASSYARFRRRDGSIRPAKLPEHITDRAADCGGYVATKIWGDYRYTAEQYVEWLDSFSPRWAAMMDYCCEPDIATNADAIRSRQDRTTANAYSMWQNYKSEPWAWVPTIQGWNPDDYTRHATELAPLIDEMATYYGKDSAFRVGVGTLCQRADIAMIRSVVKAVRRVLPTQPLHLWGVKGDALGGTDVLPGNIASVDSAAWTWAANTNRRGTGMTCREYALTVQLPAYTERFNRKVSTPRQQTLFDLAGIDF